MAGALGDLVIALHADVAKFESDMGRAARISEREWRKVGDHAASAAKALAAASLLAGAAAIKMGHDFIEAASNLDDLAEKTGASVEELSKLSQQAYISGASIETVETGLVRLAKALHGSDEEAQGAGKALNALGLKADELKNKDTAQALQIVAVELNKYADGAGKTALALDLFGKSGAQLLPLLKDMANDGALNATVTAKQAAEAEELGKAWRRLANDAKVVGQPFALDLVPKLLELIEQFREGIRIAGGFGAALRLFGMSNITQGNAGEKIRQIGDEIAALTEKRKRFIEQGRTGWTATIDAQIKDLEKQRQFASLLLQQSLGDTDNFDAKFGGTKPAMNYQQAAKAAGDFAKKLEDVKRLFGEVSALGHSMDVTVLQPSFKPADLDNTKRDLDALKKTLEESRKGWIAHAEAVFNEADAVNAAAASGESFTQWAEKNRDALLDLIDPLRVVERELKTIDTLVGTGYLSKEQGRLAKIPADVRALLNPTANVFEKIQRAWESGFLEDGEMEQALANAMQTHRVVTDEITEFWRSAAESMQQSMSQFFFDAMQGDLKSLGQRFKQTIDRMVADMLAAKAATALFGEGFGKGGSGQIGGLVGQGLDWLSRQFGAGNTGTAVVTEAMKADVWSGSYAMGTDYVPRTGLALVHQGEAIIPANQNAKGRGPIIFNVYANDPNAFRMAKRQIMGELAAMGG